MSCCFDCMLCTLLKCNDVPVLFRPLPGRPCDFSLRGQREVTKAKTTPRTRPSPIHGLRVRSQTPGFADGPSLALRRTGPHRAGHPSDLFCVCSPCSRGPVLRASCAHGSTKRIVCFRFGRGHGWLPPKWSFPPALARRRAPQRQAGARRACPSPGTGEFAPARLAREAQGSFGNTMLPKPSCRANGFGGFCRNKCHPRVRRRAEPRQGCRCVAIKDRCARSQRTTADAR